MCIRDRVRAAHQDAALLEPQVARQLKILLGRADPARDFGEAKAQLLTAPQRLLVLLTVEKELALADLSLGAAQLCLLYTSGEGLLPHVLKARENHAGHPEEDDVIPRHQRAGGVEIGQIVGLFGPAQRLSLIHI